MEADGLVTAALSLWQPWPMIMCPPHGSKPTVTKWIETRPGPPAGAMAQGTGSRQMPGARLERGERIYLHAGNRSMGSEEQNLYAESFELQQTDLGARRPRLAFGALIGSIVVDDALPIFSNMDDWAEASAPEAIVLVSEDRLVWMRNDQVQVRDVSDQLPLGWFRTGRWAWLCSAPVPLARP